MSTFNWVPNAKLDRRLVLIGTYNAGTDKTSWILPIDDQTIDTAILGPAFGELEGKVLYPLETSALLAKYRGNHSAGLVVLGRSFDMTLVPSQPYLRGESGNAVIGGRLFLRHMTVMHQNTGYYEITIEETSRKTRAEVLSKTDVEDHGSVKLWLGSESGAQTLTIGSDSPLPATITALEFDADFSPWRPK